MVCDRACNMLMFGTLTVLDLRFSQKIGFSAIFFAACVVLDFGSHWFQFLSSAYVGSESHKGKNKKEGWLVGLYYNDKKVFMGTCVGAEIGSILCFIDQHTKETLGKNLWWNCLVYFWTLVLAFKMFVNCHQWSGAVERLYEHHKVKEAEKFLNVKKNK